MARGRIIVLEGLDGSGKYTQFRLLMDKLVAEGHNVKTLDFPQYDTTMGNMVARYLRGEFGSLKSIPAQIPALLYALDRYQKKDELERWVKEGYIILLNRYVSSNLAFQGAKFKGKERQKFMGWARKVEGYLPKEDLVLFLDVPRTLAAELVLKKGTREYLKGKKKDMHEEDYAYQSEVEKTYKQLCRKYKHWKLVRCSKGKNILTKEEIAKRVWKQVREFL